MAKPRYRADYYLFRHFLMGMGCFHNDKVTSHSAMKFVFGINGPFKIRLDGRWYSARAALVGGGIPHYINGEGDWQLVLWVSGESSLGMSLAARSLKGRDWALHDAPSPPGLDEVIQTAGDDPDSAGALSIAETVIRVYGGIKAVPATWDEGVMKALDSVDSNPGAWNGRSLADSLGCSAEELSADFSRVLGLGLDDYLLARKREKYIALRQKGVGRRVALESAGLPGWDGLDEDFRARYGLDLEVLENCLPFVSVYEGRDSVPVLYL